MSYDSTYFVDIPRISISSLLIVDDDCYCYKTIEKIRYIFIKVIKNYVSNTIQGVPVTSIYSLSAPNPFFIALFVIMEPNLK